MSRDELKQLVEAAYNSDDYVNWTFIEAIRSYLEEKENDSPSS